MEPNPHGVGRGFQKGGGMYNSTESTTFLGGAELFTATLPHAYRFHKGDSGTYIVPMGPPSHQASNEGQLAASSMRPSPKHRISVSPASWLCVRAWTTGYVHTEFGGLPSLDRHVFHGVHADPTPYAGSGGGRQRNCLSPLRKRNPENDGQMGSPCLEKAMLGATVSTAMKKYNSPVLGAVAGRDWC